MPIVEKGKDIPPLTVVSVVRDSSMSETRHGGRGPSRKRACRLAGLLLVLAGPCLAGAGCCVSPEVRQTACDAALTDIPTEMQKVSIPPYRVEPPDVLSVEAVNNIRPASDP